MHSANKVVETTIMSITMIVLLDDIVVIHVLCRNNFNVHFSPGTPPDETFNILVDVFDSFGGINSKEQLLLRKVVIRI